MNSGCDIGGSEEDYFKDLTMMKRESFQLR